MVCEYIRNPELLAQFVNAAHLAVPMLSGFFQGLRGHRCFERARLRAACSAHYRRRNCDTFRRFLKAKVPMPPNRWRRMKTRSSPLLCQIALNDPLLAPPGPHAHEHFRDVGHLDPGAGQTTEHEFVVSRDP